MSTDSLDVELAAPAAEPVSIPYKVILAIAGLIVIAVILWQSLTSGGSPDPLAAKSGATAVVDIAILVFREGLECVLVIAAITASLVGASQGFRKPIGLGVFTAFIATLITWFIAVGILDSLAENVSALHLQAATGLLAIVVLLVVMNWFFHKLYWTGWISMHNRRKKALLSDAADPAVSRRKVFWGLVFLGFTSMYREGFEIVLFLQSYRLKLGGMPVLKGVVLGGFIAAIVAVIAFVANHRLPYRKMLIATGVLLGVVLLVMVGEQAQEMQLAGWLSVTPVAALESIIPDWVGLWFAVFPTVETLTAQAIALVLVLGSYVLVEVQLKKDAVGEVTASGK
jgi:high-affinity iron transporter